MDIEPLLTVMQLIAITITVIGAYLLNRDIKRIVAILLIICGVLLLFIQFRFAIIPFNFMRYGIPNVAWVLMSVPLLAVTIASISAYILGKSEESGRKKVAIFGIILAILLEMGIIFFDYTQIFTL